MTGCCWVWKLRVRGPVTYIVQCSLEGVGPLLTCASWGRWGRSQPAASWGVPESLVGGGRGLGMRLAALCPCWASPPWTGRPWLGRLLTHSPCVPGGSWITLASDVFDCCYLTGKLSGGAYTFRTACVSKAGMGPYSSPSEQVLTLGGPSAWVSSWAGLCGNALATSTGHTLTWGDSFCPLGPHPQRPE